MSSGAVSSESRRVLIVSGERALAHRLRLVLEDDGYTTLTATDLIEVARRLRESVPALVVADGRLAEGRGVELSQLIRGVSIVPLLLLVPAVESEVVVRLLDAGADDCAALSLPPLELLARVRALLRRAEMPPLVAQTTLTIDPELRIDFSRAVVLVRGQHIRLRPTEYRLLYHLVSNPGRVMTYESLLARVWGAEYREEIHYVRLYVGYLRQKLEREPTRPRYILTERGLGYRFIDYRGRVAGVPGAG